MNTANILHRKIIEEHAITNSHYVCVDDIRGQANFRILSRDEFISQLEGKDAKWIRARLERYRKEDYLGDAEFLDKNKEDKMQRVSGLRNYMNVCEALLDELE